MADTVLRKCSNCGAWDACICGVCSDCWKGKIWPYPPEDFGSLDMTFDEIVSSPDFMPVGSDEMWAALAAKNEWSFWDDTYEVLCIDDDGYDWSRPREDMPCPLDGEPMAVFDGQIDQDRMGNDIYGLGWCCACGYEDIHEVD